MLLFRRPARDEMRGKLAHLVLGACKRFERGLVFLIGGLLAFVFDERVLSRPARSAQRIDHRTDFAR